MANVVLDRLATKINAAHDEAVQLAQTAVLRARDAGNLLIDAKHRCKHGEWLKWLEGNVRMPVRTVQVYMQIASGWGKLEVAKYATIAYLPQVNDALALISSPRSYVYCDGKLWKCLFNEEQNLPDIVGKPWEGFVQSVKEHGFVENILIDDEGDVIDGRQRLRASAVLGIAAPPVTVCKEDGRGEDWRFDLWWRVNMERYHDPKLAEEQNAARAELATA